MKLDKGTALSAITIVGTVMAMLSMYGKNSVDALGGLPAMLNAWASQLPLGVMSFVLAMVLSALVWLSAHRAKFTGAHYNPDTVALCTALFVTMAQQWASGKTSAASLLTALILGAIAGLLVPYLCRLVVGKAQ